MAGYAGIPNVGTGQIRYGYNTMGFAGPPEGGTNDQMRLQQQQIDAQKGMQATGLQYGAANAAADRAQQQWAQLTGQGFQGQQNDANRALQTALQNSAQTFQGTQADLNRTFEGTQAGLNRDLTTSQNNLQRQFEGQQNDANRGQQLALQGNQLGFEGQQAGLNRDFTGSQNAAQRSFEGQQGDANRSLQLQLGMAPIQFAQSKFNSVMPLISNLLGGKGGGFGLGGGGGGGPLPQQQAVQSGDLFSQGQIDQQVNAAKAGNAQQASAASTDAARQTAGRGFGANSPLLAALQGQIQAGRMATDADSERNIRLGSAQANAGNRLQTGQLAEQQWQDAQDQAFKRQQLGFSGPASLISALGGFM